ncbi:MAG: DMT family transporter [Bacteroidales bacterium]|nr:DMT family transporter [Bacteroidales bacterium]
MTLSNQQKGYILSFIAVLAMSNVFIFSKAALNEINLFQFGVYWFGFAILWNLLYSIPGKKYRNIMKLKRKAYRALVIIGLLELIGTAFFFMAIKKVENPAIVSFLTNLTPVFVATFGILFLKERFNLLEALGFALAISGALIISYSKGKGIAEVFMDGTGYIIISCLAVSVAFIISKKFIKDIDPGVLAMNRVLFLFIFSIVLLIANDVSIAISWKAIYNLLLGSLLGPFLSAITNYSSLKYLEVSRVTIIASTKSLFVLVGAFMYFGVFPHPLQVTGGIITILGVILVITGKRILRKN